MTELWLVLSVVPWGGRSLNRTVTPGVFMECQIVPAASPERSEASSKHLKAAALWGGGFGDLSSFFRFSGET